MRIGFVVTAAVYLLTLVVLNTCSSTTLHSDTEDVLYRVMADLVEPHGYPFEQRFVTTSDGYILRLFRIPHGHISPPACCFETAVGDQAPSLSRKLKSTERASQHVLALSSNSQGLRSTENSCGGCSRPVIYLQHALVDSSADWVMQGPGKSLAFVLADAGYDVWMGNVRGNRFSRNHTTLDPNQDTAFWAFSFDQHAALDLPTLINTTLHVSGASSLAYVGYSQGTLMAFAALSSQPELAHRVRLAVLLAPVAFVTQITSLPLRAGALLDTDKLYEILGIKEYAAHSSAQTALLELLCSYRPAACLALLGAIGGSNNANVDPQLLPTFFKYFPAGTSVQNMAHWSQAVRQKEVTELRWFDWGPSCQDSSGRPKKCNQQVYGTDQPPAYNLASITTPIALFTGGNDMLADPEDVNLLLKVLQPGTVVGHHHEPDYCHWDFGIGSDLPLRVYPEILRLLGIYHPASQGTA